MNNNAAEFSEPGLSRTDSGVTAIHLNVLQEDSKLEKIDFILVYSFKGMYNTDHVKKREVYETNLRRKRGLHLEHVMDKVGEERLFD